MFPTYIPMPFTPRRNFHVHRPVWPDALPAHLPALCTGESYLQLSPVPAVLPSSRMHTDTHGPPSPPSLPSCPAFHRSSCPTRSYLMRRLTLWPPAPPALRSCPQIQLANALVSMRRLTWYFMLEDRKDVVGTLDTPGECPGTACERLCTACCRTRGQSFNQSTC